MKNARQRVLIIHSSNEMYGADRMIARFVDILSSLEQVLVLLPADFGSAESPLVSRLQSAGVQVELFDLPILRRSHISLSGFIRLTRNSFALARRIREYHPDIVICATSASLPAAPISRILGVRRVALYNHEMWSGVTRLVLSSFAVFASSIVAVSEKVRDAMPKTLQSRCIVMPNATDDANNLPIDLDAGEPVFLMASRWNVWKGHATLFRAWALAGQPGRLIICGGPPPLGQGVDIPQLVESFGISSTVEIRGEVDNISSILPRVHYVVIPSDGPEPFGLVAIEAFSAGRPVIASSDGGLGEIVEDYKTGLKFRNGDERQLATVLKLATVPLAGALGPNARQSYLEKYNLTTYRTQVLNWWTDLLLPTD